MSSGSERMIEKQQENFDKHLARYLGITYNELSELDYEMDTEESNDGLVYNYIIKFRKDAPKEILAKIQGIENNNQVWVSAAEVDNWK